VFQISDEGFLGEDLEGVMGNKVSEEDVKSLKSNRYMEGISCEL
jgi:hypothetical protein